MSVPSCTLPCGMAALKTKTNPLGAGRNPRAGKPAKPVTIRLTEDERRRFQSAADAAELTLGDWIRDACEARLGKPKTRARRA